MDSRLLTIIFIISVASLIVSIISLYFVKKLENKIEMSKVAKIKNDISYILILYAMRKFFVKHEMYEDAAIIQRFIDDEFQEKKR